MDSVVKASRIDETTWNRHRQFIERLYIQEQRKLGKEDGVIEYMKKHHNFIASKSQYELHFKKWRLRKNLTKAGWRQIIRHMRENGLRSESVVAISNGVVLSKERLDREITRYGSAEGHNGQHQGSSDLPEGVTIRSVSNVLSPRPSVPNALDTVQALPRSSQPGLIQSIIGYEPGYSGTVLAVPSSDSRNHLPVVYLRMGKFEPFSWAKDVKWDAVVQAIPSSLQLTQWKGPSATHLDATFHPTQQTLMALPNVDESTITPMYMVSSILNNMALSGQQALDDAHKWLKILPRSTVLRFLEGLPAQHLDSLRERVFASAVGRGDVDTVMAMLDSNVDPQEKIMAESTPVFPLQHAMGKGYFSVAKAITAHICRRATTSQLNKFLDGLLQQLHTLRATEMTELLCMVLSAGANPTGRCIAVANHDFDLAKEIIEAGPSSIDIWLQAGLLEEFLPDHPLHHESFSKSLLFYIFNGHLHYLPIGDSTFKKTLLGVLRSAVKRQRMWVVETILQAIHSLGYHLDIDINSGGATGDLVIQTCLGADWILSKSLLLAQTLPATELTYESRAELQRREKEELFRAVDQGNVNWVLDLLSNRKHNYLAGVTRAARLGRDAMVTEIVEQYYYEEHQDDTFYFARDELLFTLMEYGQTAAVSVLLREEPRWNAALEAAHKLRDFGILDNLLFLDSHNAPFMEAIFGFPKIDQRQIILRIIAYHAIETNDVDLYRWLLESDLDMDELVYHVNHVANGSGISKRPVLHGSVSGFQCSLAEFASVAPSLLAVAAGQNRLNWVTFLLDEGADCRDSMALLWAVKRKAEAATIRFLMEAAGTEKRRGKCIYGSAALQAAIQNRDSAMITMLCDKVDIDMAESSTDDLLEGTQNCLSPMGEAILTGDPAIVHLLLDSGANPNACVANNGLKPQKDVKNWLSRLTPLLAAIEVQDLLMVKMLVERGAEVDYPNARKWKFHRTPLQRAAEVGNFDIVRYLVEQGAMIDTVPVYSGATALQLAAMNGYVGIATFLFEQGADPNYLPAEGDGRTAFEAAAEWGRIDMMTFLMKAGVLLDLPVGDPPQSQYQRAVNFAEENGYMASKRFVEHIYAQIGEDPRWDTLHAWRDFNGGML